MKFSHHVHKSYSEILLTSVAVCEWNLPFLSSHSRGFFLYCCCLIFLTWSSSAIYTDFFLWSWLTFRQHPAGQVLMCLATLLCCHTAYLIPGVPQGSVLGPLLFLLNDLHNSVRYAKTYHFADDTSVILSSTSLEILSKRINKDLFNLSNWLKANKLSLNVKKTELVIFRSKN